MSAGAGMSLAGGSVSAVGDIYAGAMTANSLEAQADEADLQAQEAREAGQFNVLKQQRVAASAMGSATAAFGASGVSSSGGSASAILGASAANAELDRLNIIHGADIRATNYANQANIDRFGASAARTGSYFKAAGDLLGGASKGDIFGSGIADGSPGSVGNKGDVLPSTPSDFEYQSSYYGKFNNQ